MGMFDWLLGKKKPISMIVDVGDQEGADLGVAVSGEASWGGAPLAGKPHNYRQLRFELPAGTRSVNLVIKAEGFYERHVTVNVVPLAAVKMVRRHAEPPAPVPVPPAEEQSFPRPPGVVTLAQKAWTDGRGPFYPLYASLFWALGGWMRGDQKRVRENLKFLAQHKFDGARVLYYVDWPDGGNSKPTHGTPQALTELLDCAYNDYGLRLKVTVSGGGPANHQRLATDVAGVAVQHREKILLLEGVNERNCSREDAVAMGKILRNCGVPSSVGWGDEGDQAVLMGNEAGTSVDILHLERGSVGSPEFVRRLLRQCWDFHDLKRAADNGEPIGPNTSVAWCDDPFVLASMRAGGIICGAGAYCFHTGAGVYGIDYTHPQYGRRHANLWEIPNVDAMMVALRNVEKAIGHTGIENWHHDHASKWIEANGQREKQYGARVGKEFVQIVTDTLGRVGFTPLEPLKFHDCFNPATGEKYDPASGTLPAFIGRGEFL